MQLQSAEFRIGSRGSPLALWQARETKKLLLTAHSGLSEADVEIVVIKTTGDRIQDRSLASVGGKGLFTKEIEEALAAETVDLAVHSLKDVPTVLPAGLGLVAVLKREDPRDVLIGVGAISQLTPKAPVGTSSLRRRAQLLHRRPELNVVDLRGNVETRLKKVASGQIGATLLARLDGSCRTPIAALAEFVGDGLYLRAAIIRPDGSEYVATERRGADGDAERMGNDAGEELKRRGGPGFFVAA